MRFQFELIQAWPPLAWEAVCRLGSTDIVVRHGPRVEIGDNWFCEAVWDGPFCAGDFDLTDIVAGSGGRIRGGEATFVSSGSTVDRLQKLETPDEVRISNSLACLVASGEVKIDPVYLDYYYDFRSVINGLDKLKRKVHTLSGQLELCYFDNLVWDGSGVPTIRTKPGPVRDFGSFERYEAFLLDSMRQLAANARDPARRFPFALTGTLSSGYDSPAVAIIAAKAAGITDVITFQRGRGNTDDSGEAIAAQLGLRCRVLDRDAWRALDQPEVPFLSVNGYGEDAHFAAVGAQLEGHVLLTGHGGKVWAKDAKSLGPTIVRGDPTGLSLSEYRLHAGFLHCPVPYWGIRQIRDIHAISTSPALAAWDVAGDYSRPICRRIIESEGIAREQFGQVKKATAVVLWDRHEQFLTPRSMADYRDWLARHMSQFVLAGRLPPHHLARVDALKRKLLRLIERLPVRMADKIKELPGGWRLTSTNPVLFKHLFAWAVERMASRYRLSR